MRLGIFGGTFDPPHIAHLAIASEVLYQRNLDKVIFVLTANPPHKTGKEITPIDIRLKLLSAAISNNINFELSRVDIDRPPPHYAVDTIRLLVSINPHDEYIYIMGADSLMELHTWHEPNDFIESCNEIAVVKRPNFVFNPDQVECMFPEIVSKYKIIHMPLMEISSADIRYRIQIGSPVRYYLPPSVYSIISSENLYR
jgi:nicotinate-nucleotide adenylyltransferase